MAGSPVASPAGLALAQARVHVAIGKSEIRIIKKTGNPDLSLRRPGFTWRPSQMPVRRRLPALLNATPSGGCTRGYPEGRPGWCGPRRRPRQRPSRTLPPRKPRGGSTVAYKDRLGLSEGGVPVHVKSSGNDRDGEGAHEAHLMHVAAPVGQACTQAVARRAWLLAFCSFAAGIAAWPLQGRTKRKR